jgi:glycogen synthase
MVLAAFYFQMHQPMRLHPDRDKFIWSDKDKQIFLETAELCYLPATRLFIELVSAYPDFKMIMSMSGTFLEQAETYCTEVICLLQQLLDSGKGIQVEYLDETYYHSLTGLYVDQRKQEFRDQVSLHRDMMKRFFGIRPISFRNTDLIYNNEIAAVVDDMGYKSMLSERWAGTHLQNGYGIPPNQIFKAKGSNLVVIPRNNELSGAICAQFGKKGLTPREYLDRITSTTDPAVMLGYDCEHIGAWIRKDKGIFDFWREMPKLLSESPEVEVVTATEIAERFQDVDCPVFDMNESFETSWKNVGLNALGQKDIKRIGHLTQYEIFKDIESIGTDARKAGGDLLRKWRYLTESDHICFIREGRFGTRPFHHYINPYGKSTVAPAHIITRKIDNLEMTIRRFQILRKREKTVVLIISPETGKLPEEMGALAQYISGKSGGQGEVVSALCNGLVERGIEVHLATLNLKKRFQWESGMDEMGWRQMRYRIDPDRIHLVSSSLFAENMSAYSGNPVLTAAEFQREIVNNVIKIIRAKSQGRLIVHSNDWMAGGVITAYAKSTGLPVLHTVHNIFTGKIPLEMLNGVDLNSMAYDVYLTHENGRSYLDSQATAIKSATLINFVGEKFLHEVVEDYFMDRPIVPWSVREEVKQKYRHNAAISIINAPAPYMYPERCESLVRKFGPDEDVLQAKKENKVEFQRRLGLLVDPEAILFYWPSRLDPLQKGIELIENIALRFVIEHGDVQIAFIADGVGGDRTHTEILGRIAFASGGKIAYHPYYGDLSMLGFAAASDVFGASLYEPCGQIDQVGNLFGATATNRDTGGYNDKIRELRLKIMGSPQDVGNGFLFRNYDPGGLWYAMYNSVIFHRLPEAVRAEQIVRIMKESRETYDLGTMIAQYIRTYERLNNGKPLV